LQCHNLFFLKKKPNKNNTTLACPLLRHDYAHKSRLFVLHRDAAPLDDLKQLANATGGMFFYVPDHNGVQGLFGALQEALQLAQLLV
jgi:hypothetical protein